MASGLVSERAYPRSCSAPVKAGSPKLPKAQFLIVAHEAHLTCVEVRSGVRRVALPRRRPGRDCPEGMPSSSPTRTHERVELVTRSLFVPSALVPLRYKLRAFVVGSNSGFVLPRLAVGWRPASGDYEGGFTLHLDSWRDAAGVEREHIYSPWVSMLHLNPPADLKRFTRRKDPDPADLIPAPGEEPDPASPSAAICSTSRAWLHARRASPIPQAIPRERLLARPLEGRTAAHATARAA